MNEKNTNKNLEKQIKKFKKIYEKSGNLLTTYRKAYKKNAIEAFKVFLNDNGLVERFSSQAYDYTLDFDKTYSEKEKETFKEMTIDIDLKYLGKIYGKEVEAKLSRLYQNGKIRFVDITEICLIAKEVDYESKRENKTGNQIQGEIFSKIMDFYENEDILFCFHGTRGEVDGETINQNGLELTGHILGGGDSRNYYNVESKIRENVWTERDLGHALRKIAMGGGVRNRSGSKFVDVSIITIPKEQLQLSKEEQDVILEGEVQPFINPKYVAGYVTVNTEAFMLHNFVENPNCIIKNVDSNENYQKIEENENSQKIEEWVEKLQNWETISEEPKATGIKEKLMSIFKRLSPKNKSKDINKSIDVSPEISNTKEKNQEGR